MFPTAILSLLFLKIHYCSYPLKKSNVAHIKNNIRVFYSFFYDKFPP
nr:MAG TPA: hypothetical protein [Caudoviricetes sp.]